MNITEVLCREFQSAPWQAEAVIRLWEQRTAQEHQDWKNLADLLEHDLSPLLLEYKEIMTARAA